MPWNPSLGPQRAAKPDPTAQDRAIVEAVRWALKAEFGIDIPREADARLVAYVRDAKLKVPV